MILLIANPNPIIDVDSLVDDIIDWLFGNDDESNS